MKKKFSKRKTYNKRIQIPTPYGPISGSDMKELALGACFVVGTVLLVEYSKGLVKKFFQDKNTDNKIRIQNNTTQNRIKEMKAEEELARKKPKSKSMKPRLLMRFVIKPWIHIMVLAQMKSLPKSIGWMIS